MKYSRPILLISLNLSIWAGSQSIIRNSGTDTLSSSLSIFSVDAQIIDTAYIIIGNTKSIPGRPIKKIKDFVYEITLSIKVNGINTYWTSPFEVILVLPNGENRNYFLNDEEFTLSSSFIEDFKFIVDTPQKGIAKCKLSFENQPENESGLIDYNWHLFDLN